VDHLVVLRSKLPTNDIATAIAEALGNLNKPYDFEFDFNNSSRVVCTELVYRGYHGRGNISFSLTKRLGRFTLSGDDIIAQVLDAPAESANGKCCDLRPTVLILKRRDGRSYMARTELVVPWLRRIRRGWRPAEASSKSTVLSPQS
jgi:hypothetical protein